MPRKTLIRSQTFPYHIYNRVQSKKFYPDSLMPKIWEIYCDSARVITWAFGVRIQLMVLMNNHYHLLLTTPFGNIDDVMMYFQREISRRINSLVGTQEFKFASRYRWKLIENPVQYTNAYIYIVKNPVEGGLVAEAVTYPYSTLAGVFGNATHLCPCYPCLVYDGLLPATLPELERWISKECQVQVRG